MAVSSCAKMQLHAFPLLQPQLGNSGCPLLGEHKILHNRDFSHMAGLHDCSILTVSPTGTVGTGGIFHKHTP